MMNHKLTYKFAVLALHPVPYHSPIWKRLANTPEIDLRVYYGDKLNVEAYWEDEFQTVIQFDIPLLDGYPYQFLKNWSRNKHSGFFKRINPSLFRELRINDYDALLCHGYDTFSSWMALAFAKLTGTAIIFRGEANLRLDQPNRVANKVKYLILSRFLNAFDAILYSCSGNKAYFEAYDVTPTKLFPIPCAVDNTYFQNEAEKWSSKANATRDSLNIPSDALVILFSARFTSRKRPQDLIEIVCYFEQKGIDNVYALFVGDGVEKDNLSALVDSYNLKNVRFVGFQNQSKISAYYAISDIFLMSSNYDPSPKSMNEVMNFGIPIIATNAVGTTPDLVKHGENGFVVHVGDINAMIQHVSTLLENRTLLKKMGKKSLELVAKSDLESNVEGILKSLEYIASGSTTK